MNAQKTWLMLTARSVRYDSAPGGHGGLTAAAIASMLRGLPRGSFLMGMATHARDLDVLGTLELELWREIRGLAAEQEWPLAGCNDYCRRFAGLATLEAMSARPLPCTSCHGRGYTIIERNGVPCSVCASTGGRTISARTRSELMGVPYTSWRREWAERYEASHWIALTWRSQALAHLAHELEMLLDIA